MSKNAATTRLLDCETVDSTYQSLEHILKLSRADIESALAAFELDEFLAQTSNNEEFPDELIYGLIRRLTNETTFEQTCWFHITRTGNAESFREGILPLGASLDGIWSILENLARGNMSDLDLARFLNRSVEGRSGRLFNMKTQKERLHGPYAMLVKDVAFHAQEIGNHDYLAVPEIVEDICQGLAEWHDFDLLSAYMQSTRPCIVKFVSNDSSGQYLCASVNYLYRTQHGIRLNQDCNAGFNSGGKSIPAEQILKIELF